MLARLMGLFTIVPTTLVLTVSFLVLVVARKVESGALKVFGYVVTALLWASAILILSGGIFTLATGKCPMQKMMMQKHEMMCKKMMDKQMMDKPMMERNKMHEMKQ